MPYSRLVWTGALLARIWDSAPPWLRAAALRVYPLRRFRVGALALVVRPAGEVLLLHHRFRVGGAWGLPGGWLEAHEDPQGAIVRELAEELGLRVERSEVALLHIESRASRNHLEVFFRVPVADSFAVPPNFEFTDWRWFRACELPADMLPLHRGLVERWLES